jgi:hypothetical protein
MSANHPAIAAHSRGTVTRSTFKIEQNICGLRLCQERIYEGRGRGRGGAGGGEKTSNLVEQVVYRPFREILRGNVVA